MNEWIYLVDDEENILELTSFALQQAGLRVKTFLDGESFLQACRAQAPDVAVLDWMLPGMDGLTLCRMLREDAQTALVKIVFLTARSDEIDRVVGLEMGADDYIVKPFSVKEFVARVRALLRRNAPPATAPMAKVEGNGIVLDVFSRRASKDGKPLDLSLKEFELLMVLMQNPGRAMPRSVLFEKVWDGQQSEDTRTLDVHIRYLRKKLEKDPADPQILQTVRGVGYRFVKEA